MKTSNLLTGNAQNLQDGGRQDIRATLTALPSSGYQKGEHTVLGFLEPSVEAVF